MFLNAKTITNRHKETISMIAATNQLGIQKSHKSDGGGANFQKLPYFYIYKDFIINIYL